MHATSTITAQYQFFPEKLAEVFFDMSKRQLDQRIVDNMKRLLSIGWGRSMSCGQYRRFATKRGENIGSLVQELDPGLIAMAEKRLNDRSSGYQN